MQSTAAKLTLNMEKTSDSSAEGAAAAGLGLAFTHLNVSTVSLPFNQMPAISEAG